jgi:hypothetical protein
LFTEYSIEDTHTNRFLFLLGLQKSPELEPKVDDGDFANKYAMYRLALNTEMLSEALEMWEVKG